MFLYCSIKFLPVMLHDGVVTNAIPGDASCVAAGIFTGVGVGVGGGGTCIQLSAGACSPKLAMLNLAVIPFAATKAPLLSMEVFFNFAGKMLLLPGVAQF